MSTFKIGETVKLKSGGPKMTVTHVFPGDQFGVCYFSDRTSMREQFPGDALGIPESPMMTETEAKVAASRKRQVTEENKKWTDHKVKFLASIANEPQFRERNVVEGSIINIGDVIRVGMYGDTESGFLVHLDWVVSSVFKRGGRIFVEIESQPEPGKTQFMEITQEAAVALKVSPYHTS